MDKTVNLGAKLHYPITIERIYKKPGDKVERKDTVLEYSYIWHRVVGDDTRDIEERQKVVTTVTWASPVDGDIRDIFVCEGQVIDDDTRCLMVNESCNHEIQFSGMCGICGKDMTTVTWASDERDADRATVTMTHDHTSLTVSTAVAQRYATEQQTRLLTQRKLSLVVDLDQTIIHACIDPTVGEWQRDSTNPNYNAVKDVRSFQLNDECGPRGLATGCWYYIKLRPGLQEFLEDISDMYEMHVYTMGTRAYAQNIAKLVDPDQKLFGNRLISRDENGSLTAKNLERLFPTSTGMVAIIDDRADVWPRDRDNLIKVVPYDFFKGIGDINSSFLPKRQDIAPAPDPAPSENGNGKKTTDSKAEDGKPAAAELAALGDDSAILKKQAEEQEHLLEKQLKERPLLHQQEQLDKEDELANSTQPTATADDSGDSDPSSSQLSTHQRHNLLRDDDTELIHLSQHLSNLHREFYYEYDHRRTASDAAGPSANVDLSLLPDVGRVLSGLKRRVLAGTTIVVSGLVPVDIPVHSSELGRQVKSFGATMHSKVTPRTTHLVISTARPRTQKVRHAARIPSIKIVSQNWLVDSMSQWRRLDTKPYKVDVHPADRLQPIKQAPAKEGEEDASTSDARSKRPHPGKLILKVQDASGEDVTLDNEEEGDGFNSDDEGISHLTNDEDGGEDGEDGGGDDDDPELEALKAYQPNDLRDGESSPIDEMTFDWGGADEELAEFLEDASDDSDDDEENNDEKKGGLLKPTANGFGPRRISGGLKRRLEDTDKEDGDSHAERETTKRPRVESKGPREEAAGVLPTPMGTGDEDDEDPNLEADLMAMLEAEEAEEAEKG